MPCQHIYPGNKRDAAPCYPGSSPCAVYSRVCPYSRTFSRAGGTDLIERIALSFGLSIAVVPLIGLGLNYTPWGIRLDPIVISLSVFTLAMTMIAQWRRAVTDPEERYRFPAREIIAGISEEFFPREGSRTDKILSIILLISIVAAIGTTIFVIVFPKEGEKFTEFYILGAKRMAADYPDRMTIGRSTMYRDR